MKSLITIILLIISTGSFAVCEEYIKAFDQFVYSETETNKNIIRYLDQNAKSWSDADQLISSGQLTRRNYNGDMRGTATNSLTNANALRQRNQQIAALAEVMKAEFARCLQEATSIKP